MEVVEVEEKNYFQIRELDKWPIIREAFIDSPELISEDTLVAVEDNGRTLAALLNSRVFWMRLFPNKEPDEIRTIEPLCGKGAHSIFLIEGTIFINNLEKELYCWHPIVNANILFDETDSRRNDPFVASNVKFFESGFQHVLIAIGGENSDKVQVYSFNKRNLIGEPMKGFPTMREIDFKKRIMAIACCRYDGSAVLLEGNQLIVWGSWNGKMSGEHLNRYFMFEFCRLLYGVLVNISVTLTDILLRNSNGLIFHIEYNDPCFLFSSNKILLRPIFDRVRYLVTHNASSSFLIVNKAGQVFCQERKTINRRTVTELDMIRSLPDIFITHVYQSTPIMKTYVYTETRSIAQMRYLEKFNSIHDSCMAIDLNGYIFYAHYSTLSKRVYQECKTIRKYAYERRVFDDLVVSTFISNLNYVDTCISYEFLYYLYTGYLRLDEIYWGTLLILAEKLGCETLEKFLKIENERRNLVRRAKGLALICLTEKQLFELFEFPDIKKPIVLDSRDIPTTDVKIQIV